MGRGCGPAGILCVIVVMCGGFWCGRWLVVKFGVSWRFLSWAGGVVCLGRVVECKLGEGGSERRI